MMKIKLFLWIPPWALLLSFCKNPDVSRIPENPNILFIAVDDLRPELNCYGATHIQSPNIDRLASAGMMFESAYCQVPVCGASRASLLTGLRPSRERFLRYDTRAEKDAPGIPSLPAYFKANGYYTLSNGKVFHHRDDMKESWSETPWHPSMEVKGPNLWRDYQRPENIEIALAHNGSGPAYEYKEGHDTLYFDGKIAAKSLRDLEKLKDQEQPFFLAVGFLKPHLPFNAPAAYWDAYDPSGIRLPENREAPEHAPSASLHNWGELRAYYGIPEEGPLPDSLARKLIHGYYACVSYTDAQIGKLLDQLEALELEKNTVVILWGDHGWNLGEHGLWCKHCNYETSLHAPLLLKLPWKHEGLRTGALVEFIDIYPTLCEVAGLPKPGHLQGESLLPFFEDPSREGKKYVYSRFHQGESVKDRTHRYTEWLDNDLNRYAEMLYDHRVDPGENYNISGDSLEQDRIKNFQNQQQELRVELKN